MSAEGVTLADFLLARIADDIAGIAYIDGVNWTGERVLAECEAKRRIVESCREDYEDAQGRNDDTTEVVEEVLWSLTLPYADHPDYREEWKP